ncbi:cell wall-binding repeat-containing protein [Agromyces aurantiacus]|uniref:Cell wall-binding repeat-containing protein n=1 Tax=Agromyces aurantiacus TaxID=165814 RepID=A0ABV9R0G3_9MICO|nr:cell wall-binding repeat-containing protein [Agromyces aurantiacus]MBM7505908.1 putative cell wall-binding protein [Agromyces aurantiacus]
MARTTFLPTFLVLLMLPPVRGSQPRVAGPRAEQAVTLSATRTRSTSLVTRTFTAIASAVTITAAAVLLPVSTATAAPQPGTSVAPAVLLDELTVAVDSSVPYDRDRFAEGIDVDGDGCNTRREVLQLESLIPVTIAAGCDITAGEWFSWYDGVTQTDPATLEMDHLVALKEAWISGAYAWTDQQRADYANDLEIDATLTMVTAAQNSAKSAYDPAQWVPSFTPSLCRYASDWITVKYRWNLTIDVAEQAALASLIQQNCGAFEVVVPPVRTDTASTPDAGGGVNALPAGTHRLAGLDRYATAVQISARFNPGVDALYIATGTNYPDALSASAAAGARGVPLLLVQPTAVPDVVWQEILRLAPDAIVIAGGTGVVSAAVESKLASVAPVERLAGPDRYATGRLIAEDAGLTSDVAFVADGRNFPDALSAAAVSGAYGGGVVLVPGGASSLDLATRTTLTNIGASTVRIAGGTGAVSSGIENSLQSAFAEVTRHGGSDRYATSVLVNGAGFSSASTVFLANGTNFPDALAGGALAGSLGAPMFIVQQGCVPKVVRDQILAFAPDTVVLLGGTGSLSSAVASLTECASAPAPTPTPTPSNPGNTKNCSDFATWSQAQSWFNYYYPYYGDVAQLDMDNDMIACESLPGAP